MLTAGDGASGLGLIREQRPHLAFVDLGLPMLDGCGVVETLRKECPDLRTRMIALTGYGDATERERTMRAGFHAHLVKPATAATILACVMKQLDEIRQPTREGGSRPSTSVLRDCPPVP